MEASFSPSSARDDQLLPRTSGSGFRTKSRVRREPHLTTVKGKDTEVHIAGLRHPHTHIHICTCITIHTDRAVLHRYMCGYTHSRGHMQPHMNMKEQKDPDMFMDCVTHSDP